VTLGRGTLHCAAAAACTQIVFQIHSRHRVLCPTSVYIVMSLARSFVSSSDLQPMPRLGEYPSGTHREAGLTLYPIGLGGEMSESSASFSHRFSMYVRTTMEGLFGGLAEQSSRGLLLYIRVSESVLFVFIQIININFKSFTSISRPSGRLFTTPIASIATI
jgi:hypothetical protein